MGRADGSQRQVSAADVDDSESAILHVDMDAFFASVELLERPDARGKPAIVGHAGGRGVVTSATYEARRYGVRSAMPMSQALRLCPNAIILPPHYDRYTEYSAKVMDIFREVTPLVEPLSIDEAFLDVSGARRLLGSPRRIAELIRSRVQEETGLTCSVGVAATKFMAKLASGRAKPDGLLVIPRSETLAFLRPLQVGALWGVGASTQASLERMGLLTVGDLADAPLHVLQKAVGDASGRKLHELANGRDDRGIVTESREKSIGHENTFGTDVGDLDVLRREFLRLSGRVGERLRKHAMIARTVSIKVRFSDFRTITRSRTLAEPTNVGRRLFEEAWDVFGALNLDVRQTPLRLIGVRAEQLLEAGGDAVALWDPDEEWRETERTLDAVSARFGRGMIGPASLVRRARDADEEERDGRNPKYVSD
ncbi:DNA polymerase-4 [Leifsonia sp. 98AMF]|uniref:DNA polymerase IV n=1 Tax=unclassified Leifsonia TaxID=2663824 RepID=UPI0008798E31|nr:MULTISPECIES: DNA polymerase IV [unclassified Leifsonia]SDH30182.1 DNA polymerase-4 [Leifsonia sp. 197AMF]SDJ06140.1 DNA polymerase-4 [Leifsonia sp. 466MF]SDJ65831.1 DNA polymerase-4 [Leifsonia sp. 157MF]SDN26696.1 DNA polymerase-4 [Leifsonia sp. 509MF]SEM93999.1 DNA polymerase-4 [Leifsonia sp. 467MF]